MKLQVLVASDHSIVREGLVQLLNSNETIQAHWGPLSRRGVSEQDPDVILCAIEPRPDAGSVITRLRQAFPAAPVLCLLLASDPNTAIGALRAGAIGVIDETFGADDLIESLDQARERKFIMSNALAVRLAQQYAQGQAGARNIQPEGELTNREMEVLRLLAEGCTNREIANRLSLSEHTVRAHLRGVMQKLQVSNRVQAAALAWQGLALQGAGFSGG
jgi:DNA-binding NarL/FixJ family response regulator